jgi:ADP-ribose pyrophosphatase YjhB (NUDIX family)
MRQVTTLAMIERPGEVLLAMKKRGFGEGWYNGYGGKVEDESVEHGMIREVKEESGLVVLESRARGVVEFIFAGTPKIVEMHIFEVVSFEGELVETDEMRPKWFKLEEIPYDCMWPADRIWVPEYLKGKNIGGSAVFDGVTKQFLRSDFEFDRRQETEK